MIRFTHWSDAAPKMLWAAAAIGFLTLGNASPGTAQELTGRQMITSCHDVIMGKSTGGSSFCLGAVRTVEKLELSEHYWGTCMVYGPTLGERVAVVVSWMSAHPEKVGEDFVVCIILAIKAAYPC